MEGEGKKLVSEHQLPLREGDAFPAKLQLASQPFPHPNSPPLGWGLAGLLLIPIHGVTSNRLGWGPWLSQHMVPCVSLAPQTLSHTPPVARIPKAPAKSEADCPGVGRKRIWGGQSLEGKGSCSFSVWRRGMGIDGHREVAAREHAGASLINMGDRTSGWGGQAGALAMRATGAGWRCLCQGRGQRDTLVCQPLTLPLPWQAPSRR